jgi:hypothetical protein
VEVEVTLGREDFLALQKYHSRVNKPPPGLRLRLRVIRVGTYVLVGCAAAAVASMEEWWYAVPLAVAYLAGALVVWGPMNLTSRYALNEMIEESVKKYKDRPWTMSIAAEGLTVKSRTSQSFYRWEHFREVVETGNHIFLFEAKWEAIIIPRTCFATDQDFQNFGELCSRYFEDAANAPPSRPTGFTTGLPQTTSPRTDEFTNVPPTS